MWILFINGVCFTEVTVGLLWCTGNDIAYCCIPLQIVPLLKKKDLDHWMAIMDSMLTVSKFSAIISLLLTYYSK